MAVVLERVTASGARVVMRDDCYRDATPEEIERRYARVWAVMCQIARNAAKSDRRRDDPAAANEG